MIGLVRRSLVTVAMIVCGHSAFAQQQFTLDMGDVVLNGQAQIIPLKQEILRRYNVRLDDDRLLNVRLVAKSEFGRGDARIKTATGVTSPLRINGRPMDFHNPNPQTFDRIDIDTRFLQSVGSFWQLELNGTIRVRRIVVSVAPQYQQPPVQAPDMQIHRFYTGRAHFWTLNYNEGINAGFRYEGVSFRSHQRALPGSNQLFRCYNGTTHYVSREASCEGGHMEGSLGFISRNRSPNARTELVRCRRDIGGSFIHLVTTNQSECYNNGYVVEGPLGWVQ